MKSASRRQSGASPRWSGRNGCGAIRLPRLALIVGVSFVMPDIAVKIQTGGYAGFETAASVFHGGAALGYIVIGLLAFLLGVCVTVLCFRLRQMNQDDTQDKESEERHGAD